MTLKQFAVEQKLWSQVVAVITDSLPPAEVETFLGTIGSLPIRSSRAVRSLGTYVSKGGVPHAIRLQFAQEPENLHTTFLHELAHLCDHLTRRPGQAYRSAHGPHWRQWAQRFGIAAERCGSSAALRQLHNERLKLIATCQKCGAQFHRLRRLPRRRKFYHTECGGRLLPS